MQVRTGITLAALVISAAFLSAQTAPTTSNTQSTTAMSSNTSTASMSGDPAVESNLQKMEQELTEAYKAKNGAPFQQYLDDNILVIIPGHKETGKAAVIQGITTNKCTINSATTSDFSYKWISPDAVLVTYTEKGDEVCDGKPMPTTIYSTSLWVKKNGKWVNAFHQSTLELQGNTQASATTTPQT